MNRMILCKCLSIQYYNRPCTTLYIHPCKSLYTLHYSRYKKSYFHYLRYLKMTLHRCQMMNHYK